MWFLSGVLLATSLSMDALGIGISYGLRGVKVPNLPKLIISFISLLFTAIAIGIGNIIVLFLPDYLAKLIGAGMLIILGVVIVVQALCKKEKSDIEMPQKDKIWIWNIKSLGLSVKITQNAENVVKNSNRMSVKESIYMGVALSVDSFGAGISSAVSGMNNVFVPIMVGVCQFLFLSFGIFCGQKLTSFKHFNSNVFMVLSGSLLIALALVRFFL